MGTDIHGWVQVKHSGSEWLSVEGIYDDRNYILFDVLAGGRHGDTGPVRPFVEARGLPEDYRINTKCQDWCECRDKDFDGHHSITDWWATKEGGGHCQSWWDLRKLVLHPGWDWAYTQSGWISRERFESWDHKEPPYPYSGYVGGAVRHAEYGPDGIEGPEDWTHIRVTWVETPASNCHVFMKWADYILAKYELAKEIRIVFGFDS